MQLRTIILSIMLSFIVSLSGQPINILIEGNIGATLDFLQLLHDKHEVWLIDKKYGSKWPILVLDGDEDFMNNVEVRHKYVEKILDFLQEQFCTTQITLLLKFISQEG